MQCNGRECGAREPEEEEAVQCEPSDRQQHAAGAAVADQPIQQFHTQPRWRRTKVMPD